MERNRNDLTTIYKTEMGYRDGCLKLFWVYIYEDEYIKYMYAHWLSYDYKKLKEVHRKVKINCNKTGLYFKANYKTYYICKEGTQDILKEI